MGRQPTGRPIGRPTVLTPKVQRTILDVVAAGNFLTTACRIAGINKQTVYLRRKQCEEGNPRAVHLAGFFDSLKRAEAEGEVKALARLRQGGPDWLADAWFLSRRHPERWSARKRVAVSNGQGDDPLPKALGIAQAYRDRSSDEG